MKTVSPNEPAAELNPVQVRNAEKEFGQNTVGIYQSAYQGGELSLLYYFINAEIPTLLLSR